MSNLEIRPRGYVSTAEPDTGSEKLLLTTRMGYLGKTSQMSRPDKPPRRHGGPPGVARPARDCDTQPEFASYADFPDLVRPGVQATRGARFPPAVDATDKVTAAPPLYTVALKPRPRHGSAR